MKRVLIHATTIQLMGHGVLIFGDSGAGKSDLALRLIAEGAFLVADDQTELALRGDCLVATAPSTIAGKIEVRGLGIMAAPHTESANLRLAVHLATLIERMPEASFWQPPDLAAAPRLPLVALAPFEPSAVVKLRMALSAVTLA
jgi:serine kinase of HPr protein (carbohydrate metabolism regulator)